MKDPCQRARHAMPCQLSSLSSVCHGDKIFPPISSSLPSLPSLLLPPSSTSVSDVNTTQPQQTPPPLPCHAMKTPPCPRPRPRPRPRPCPHLISSHLILIFIFHHHAVKHALTLPNEPPLPLPCWWSGERKSQPGINLLVWPRLVLRTCVACSPRAPAASMRPPLYSTVLYFTVRTYI